MKILEHPMARAELIEESRNFIDENTIKAVVDIERGIVAVDAAI